MKITIITQFETIEVSDLDTDPHEVSITAWTFAAAGSLPAYTQTVQVLDMPAWAVALGRAAGTGIRIMRPILETHYRGGAT